MRSVHVFRRRGTESERRFLDLSIFPWKSFNSLVGMYCLIVSLSVQSR